MKYLLPWLAFILLIATFLWFIWMLGAFSSDQPSTPSALPSKPIVWEGM